MVIALFIALLTLSPKVDAAEQPYFHGKTITSLRGAKDPAFRKDWEDVVLEGSLSSKCLPVRKFSKM